MTRQVKIKNLILGGGNRILIQSMTNTNTGDLVKTTSQVEALALAGCDMVRIAVSTVEEIDNLKPLLYSCSVPLIADIQFDYRLAVKAADAGFSKIRFNPGNIGAEDKVKEVVAACKRNGVPIRVGVNGGSVEKEILDKYGKTPESLAFSALEAVKILEKCSFYDTVISVKASNVLDTIAANRILHKKTDYPLHIGLTESGAGDYALVKSAIGIGSLISDGIGDTVRVSLTADPVEEITAAKLILRAAGKLKEGVEVVSCPTCSRCKVGLAAIAKEVSEFCKDIKAPLKIAVMGCAVNGPGEAKDADAGIAFGKEKAAIFKSGEIIKTVENGRSIAGLKKVILDILEGTN